MELKQQQTTKGPSLTMVLSQGDMHPGLFIKSANLTLTLLLFLSCLENLL